MTKGATVPLCTTLVFVSMTIPEDSEAEYTGGDLYLGLTCPPAKAGECGLRISFVVNNEIFWEPHPSDNVTASLRGDPVVILVSGEVLLLYNVNQRSQSLTVSIQPRAWMTGAGR